MLAQSDPNNRRILYYENKTNRKASRNNSISEDNASSVFVGFKLDDCDVVVLDEVRKYLQINYWLYYIQIDMEMKSSGLDF